ncbi:MAG: lipoprotein [Bacteroidota bacterium]
MKKIFLFFIGTAILASCSSSDPADKKANWLN